MTEPFEVSMKKAEAGDGASLVVVGVAYLHGRENLPKNAKTALSYFQRAQATADNTEALYYLGMCARNGFGRKPSFEEAFQYWTKSAARKHAASITAIGNMHFYGNYVPVNHEKSFQCYEKAAKLGHTAAQYFTGLSYERGKGVERNNERALHYYNMAAKNNHWEAWYHIGILNNSKNGNNAQKALEAFTRAYELHPSGDTCSRLGYLLSRNLPGIEKNNALALKYYEEGAEREHGECCRYAANMHMRGLGAVANQEKALKYYRLGVTYGDISCHYEMGRITLQGRFGVGLDPAEGIRLLAIAANGNHGPALNMLGQQYLLGNAVPKNAERAVELFRRSAELGHGNGQLSLGRAYHLGVGVERNVGEAKRLYSLAVQQRVYVAEKYLLELEDREVKR